MAPPRPTDHDGEDDRPTDRTIRLRERYRLSDVDVDAVSDLLALHDGCRAMVVRFEAVSDAVAKPSGGSADDRSADELTTDELVVDRGLLDRLDLRGAGGSTVDDPDDPDDPAGPAPSAAQTRAALARLAQPPVIEALRLEAVAAPNGAAALGVLVDSLLARAPRGAQAPLRWLRGIANEELGNPVAAEKDFTLALDLDATYRPALHDLARCAADRGDAPRAMALYQRSGMAPDDVPMQVLKHFGTSSAPDLSRNDRCWCGSGRKYKQCHLGREQLPIEERAAWLYQKAGLFIQEGLWLDEIIAVARGRARTDPEVDPEAFLETIDDPIVADAVMFEGGGLAAFLAARGALLPDDERALGEQWLSIERSVFETVATEPGEGFTVDDLRHGARSVVRDRAASRFLHVGDLVCTRIVPAGDTRQSFGGIELVPARYRAALIRVLDGQPSATELVAFLSQPFVAPRLSGATGSDDAGWSATVRVTDADRLTDVLAVAYGAYELDDRATPGSVGPAGPAGLDRWWTVGDDGDGEGDGDEPGGGRVRATFRQSGTTLRIEAVDEPLLAELLEVATGGGCDASIVDPPGPIDRESARPSPDASP